jgi:hypothetical protein
MLGALRSARLVVSVVSAVMASAALVVAAAPAGARAGHPAGLVGRPFTLAAVDALNAYDVGARANGTAYIGWISSRSGGPRRVHFCRLPVGATSCTGGIKTIDALDGSSAAGLRVVVTSDNVVHLLWFHDTPDSINGPNHGAIAEATAPDGRNLTAGHDVVTNAPSFGQLLDAERGPSGTIWTVAYRGVPTKSVQVRPGLSAGALTVATPFFVGYAQLAFSGGTAVMTIEKYGSISTPVYWARRPAGGVFGGFHAVARTWAVGTNAALATTRHGLRLVTEINNASYRPVISKWTGSGFTRRALTADHNSCAPNTHDGRADGSGRLLDVSWECNAVTVTNYADAYHAAITRFTVSNTPILAPQIASGTRGIATVAYSTQKSSNPITLRIARVRLPDSTRRVSKVATAGRVTVTGPRSCLPPVNVRIGWTHRGRNGWAFTSGALRLAGKVVSSTTLDGARLTAGQTYSLVGTAHFAKSGHHRTVQATLRFTTCANG